MFGFPFIFPICIRRKTQTGQTACNTRLLFRLSKKTSTFPVSENIFENVYHIEPIVENEPLPIFYFIFVKMANGSKTRLKQIYQNNKQWKGILNSVNPQNETAITDENSPTPKTLRFRYKYEFVYYINEFNRKKRLCIPKT